MKRVCAWCKQELGQKDAEKEQKSSITHGICDDCLRGVSSRIGIKLQSYLNTLDVPVLAVDSDVVVKIPNTKASALLKKDGIAMVDRLGGDVFECAYARLPGGCGKTVHCSGCAIRIAVQETWRTGVPRIRVPAYLRQGPPGAEDEISMHISTEKIGDLVLLRIDREGKDRRS